MMLRLPLGPVMVDVEGLVLTAEERLRLAHPLVGGVILFSRNFESLAQLRTLTGAIHALRDPALPIAVDHEGGRVQRFRDGFTRLPPMRALGAIYQRDSAAGLRAAEATGYVLAAELLAAGVDFSFTPVLDVDFGASSIIGDRAFAADPQAIADLAGGLIAGMAQAGMASVGKHFPGHGYVPADSHVAIPVDEREFDAIAAADLVPYRTLIAKGLDGIMPAHVIYPRVDASPAGFSALWLRTILRRQLGFDGVIFSDDLSMEGASVAGGMTDRAQAALEAGCDMVLVCNAPTAAEGLLRELKAAPPESRRIERMRGRFVGALDADRQYASALQIFKDALA
jgi:beta-N-acetylhexosaminidase